MLLVLNILVVERDLIITWQIRSFVYISALFPVFYTDICISDIGAHIQTQLAYPFNLRTAEPFQAYAPGG